MCRADRDRRLRPLEGLRHRDRAPYLGDENRAEMGRRWDNWGNWGHRQHRVPTDGHWTHQVRRPHREVDVRRTDHLPVGHRLAGLPPGLPLDYHSLDTVDVARWSSTYPHVFATNGVNGCRPWRGTCRVADGRHFLAQAYQKRIPTATPASRPSV